MHVCVCIPTLETYRTKPWHHIMLVNMQEVFLYLREMFMQPVWSCTWINLLQVVFLHVFQIQGKVLVIQELSYMGFGFLPCVIIWKGLVLAFQGTTGCPGILMILLRVAFLIKIASCFPTFLWFLSSGKFCLFMYCQTSVLVLVWVHGFWFRNVTTGQHGIFMILSMLHAT